jgi:predicted ArsR family transcriptional regulator
VFEGRRHELNVSTYQMCILALFNTNDELSLAAIKGTLRIPDHELKRHLVRCVNKQYTSSVNVDSTFV